MKKLLAALLLSAVLIPLAIADVPIPREYRQINRLPGRCVWCALETLCCYHGYKDCEGLVDRNARLGYRHDYEEQLKKYKVKFEQIYLTGTMKTHQWTIDKHVIDTWDTSRLEWASDKEYGCAVGMWCNDWLTKHMLVLTEFDKTAKIVKVIDSNNKKKETETASLAWFLYYWDGSIIIIYPKKE